MTRAAPTGARQRWFLWNIKGLAAAERLLALQARECSRTHRSEVCPSEAVPVIEDSRHVSWLWLLTLSDKDEDFWDR